MLLIAAAAAMLAVMYLMQQTDFFYFFIRIFPTGSILHTPAKAFIFNKTFRLIVNDFACLIIIFAIFREKKYFQVALYVFLFEAMVMLPLYFLIKLQTEGSSETSSPLLSQIHRLVVNPTLMIILIISFFYQKLKVKQAR